MSETAQIIVALAIPMVALTRIIWVIRCPKDSPNYRLPPLRMPWLREGSD